MVAAESIECTENAVNTCKEHECLIVDHAETVETIVMDGNHNDDEREDLFLISKGQNDKKIALSILKNPANSHLTG